MKKLYLILFATLLIIPMFNGVALGWGSSGGDGTSYGALQETAVFFNNSGSTLSAGDVVILDLSGTGVASGTTLGAYVTTTTSADVQYVAGVVKTRSSADQTPVVVITAGPAETFCDNVNGTALVNGLNNLGGKIQGGAVGTYTTAATCDSGSNLGISLGAAGGVDKNDNNKSWVWVELGVE